MMRGNGKNISRMGPIHTHHHGFAGPVRIAPCVEDGSTPRSPLYVHDHASLSFYVRGEAIIQHRQTLAVRAGDILLMPAGETHRSLSSTNRSQWGIGFRAADFSESGIEPLLEPFERARQGSSPIVRIPDHRRAYLEQLCAELHHETSHPANGARHQPIVQKNLLALILAEVARAASVTAASPSQPTFTSAALSFIEANYLRPISLNDVAAAVGRSPSYTTTSLKRATGKSVVEWIIAARLAEARNRLIQTDEMVDVIAERVGYADTTHFIRLFRRAHGVTPAAWRAQQQLRRHRS
ncbi:AraC family transcriptional regulator [Pendulispora albinea]|uniref:AraC family transcriptional regulator n=1 Tax=Pendulispora albinea TaxID=2741071 RepID=A0ABZ2LVU1_9BACT